MAGARKLQAEVDRTLKQIGEHIAEFDLVWEKVAVAPTPNQKEKYESDLKKEIKKLQRLRDACKLFIAHHDVKNKKPLLDVRKQIETKMEQFKVLEKETKTKAYSKEGLSQAASRGRGGAGGGEDEERREDSRQWLDEAAEQLEAQRDGLEQRVEAAREAQAGNAAKGKKKAKGSADGQLEELQRQVERHLWHLTKLAAIKDRLDDEQLTAEQVDAVRDAVDDFVSNNAEPDFQEDESIYDELDLSEQSAAAAEGGEGEDDDAHAAGKPAEEVAESGGAGEKETEEEEDKKTPTSPVKSRPAAAAVTAAAAASPAAAAPPARPAVSINAKTTGVINTGKVTPTNAATAASAQSVAPAAKPAAAAAAASPSLITPITRITPSSTPVSAAPKPVLTVGTVASGPAASAAVAAGNGKKAPTPLVAPAPVSSLPVVKPMESLASIVMKGGRADEQRRGAAAGTVNTVTPLTAITPVAAANTAAAMVARTLAASTPAPNPGSKPAPAPAPASAKPEQQQPQQQPTSRPPLIAPVMKITTSTPSASPPAISSATPTNASSSSISSAPSTPSFTSTPPSPSPVTAAVSAPGAATPAAAASSIPPSAAPSAPPSRPSSSASVNQPADEPSFASSLPPQQLPMFVNSIALPAAALPASSQSGALPASAVTPQPAGFEHHPAYPFPSSSPPSAPAATPALSSISSSSSSSPPSSLPSPLSKDRERGLIPDDYFYTLSLLESSLSLSHFPHPADTDRPKPYTPRNPYRTPPYFPSSPPPLFDDPQLFEKLSVDTLFFIFYFQQGTPHQYLAARELKKQSWRYHKNFLTWFQRHDDPKLTSDEYEQGTYVYFDYESGWCQRIKADFTFEYRHLECEDIEGIASQVTQFGRG